MLCPSSRACSNSDAQAHQKIDEGHNCMYVAVCNSAVQSSAYPAYKSLDRQGKKDRGEYQNDCVCATVKQCVLRERHNAQLSFRKSTSSPNPGLAREIARRLVFSDCWRCRYCAVQLGGRSPKLNRWSSLTTSERWGTVQSRVNPSLIR